MNIQITRRFLFYYSASLLLSTKLGFSSEIKLPSQIIGSKDAQIVVKEYFSLTCGHCANFHTKTFPLIKKKMIETGLIQFEFIDYPLDKLAMLAVALVRSLPKESYQEAINLLFKNQKKWAYSAKPIVELMNISKMFGISKNSFEKIMENYDLMQTILNKIEEESKKHDIQSTPTFIINDEYKITGSLTFSEFRNKIDEFKSSKN